MNTTSVRVVSDDGTTYVLPVANIEVNRIVERESGRVIPRPFRFSASVRGRITGETRLSYDLFGLLFGAACVPPEPSRLLYSPILREIPGTAAYGAALGGTLNIGQVYRQTTDREARFVRAGLRSRALDLDPIGPSGRRFIVVGGSMRRRSLHGRPVAADINAPAGWRARSAERPAPSVTAVSVPPAPAPPYTWSNNS